MPTTRRTRSSNIWLSAGVLLLAILLAVLIAKKYSDRTPPQQPQPSPVQQEGVRQVVLFFGTADGAGLVRESRDIDPCSSVTECAEEVLGELINGPLGDLAPTLPDTGTFHGVSIDGSILTVDVGRELQDGISAGSSAEITALYSVVNSMAVNFPQVKQVRFLVEGKGVETLKGHIDLREPLAPDFSLEKKAESPAAQPDTQRRAQ